MRLWTACLALTICVSCANEDAATSTNNATSSTNNATGASNNTTMSAICTPGAVAQTVPYSAGGRLPFVFDNPARFGNLDASTPQAVAGSTFSIASTGAAAFEMAYSLQRSPTEDPEAVTVRWGRAGETETVVDYDGTPIPAWGADGDDVDTLHVLIPLSGRDYEATFQWRGPANCLSERRAIRDLLVTSIASNPSSTFPD